MVFRKIYHTPDGFSDMMMVSDGASLTGLWFIDPGKESAETEFGFNANESVFQDAVRWLDLYFSGKEPDFTPAYRIQGLTPFREEVIHQMLTIPYGQTVTYGQIAAKIAAAHGSTRMSAQAVGGAVGWNPLCILIPCHRVVGSNHSLTGYGGGMANKVALLRLEGVDLSRFTVPAKGTALAIRPARITDEP